LNGMLADSGPGLKEPAPAFGSAVIQAEK